MGLEPTIFGSGNRRLIHLATGTIGHAGDRTLDPELIRLMLYHLSYATSPTVGIEPTTIRLKGGRSTD